VDGDLSESSLVDPISEPGARIHAPSTLRISVSTAATAHECG
jgi:hypothetical protein